MMMMVAMKTYVVCLILVTVQIVYAREVGSSTEGFPWPQPRMSVYGSSNLPMDPSFKLSPPRVACAIVLEAVKRYRKLVFPYPSALTTRETTPPAAPRPPLIANSFTALNLSLNGPCEKYPYFGMNENYTLYTWENGTGIVNASTVWGLLRGLETFSQLVYMTSPGTYHIRTAKIVDWPRFSHRGILLDTSRHFIPLKTILQNVDLMAQNKFNVFHWHIVDDPSFPYQSQLFPELDKKGAYSGRHVYSQKDIAAVVEYARLRAVRVVVEFDTPGHTASWGQGQPELLTKCYKNGSPTGQKLLLDPTRDSTWDFLLAFFKEILTVFPDKYVHLGGDEVSYEYWCWLNNPQVVRFMQVWNFTKGSDLEAYYFKHFLPMLERARRNTGYIVWQEVLDHHIALRDDTIAHVWKGNTQTQINAEMADVTARGYRAILSSCWYLNYIAYGSDWKKFYTCDPQSFSGTEAQKNLVVGGEACMWGEMVDATNVIPRLWPRASAVAERLWSDPTVNNAALAAPRLEELRCRLVARGYPVQPPNGPSFCPIEWNT